MVVCVYGCMYVYDLGPFSSGVKNRASNQYVWTVLYDCVCVCVPTHV